MAAHLSQREQIRNSLGNFAATVEILPLQTAVSVLLHRSAVCCTARGFTTAVPRKTTPVHDEVPHHVTIPTNLAQPHVPVFTPRNPKSERMGGRKGVVVVWWWVLLAVDIRQSLGGELFTARAFNEIMPGSVPKQVALRSRTCQTLVAAPRFFRLSCTTRRALKRATRHSISSRRSRRYRRAFTPAYDDWTRPTVLLPQRYVASCSRAA